jgi:hypothetical protein
MQAWIDMHPLNKDTVLEYFSHSPFFDKTSVNALMKMQFLNNPARMLSVDGVQFVVVPNKHEPALFIIVKQIKKEEVRREEERRRRSSCDRSATAM